MFIYIYKIYKNSMILLCLECAWMMPIRACTLIKCTVH